MQILIIYGSLEGQTKKISERIRDTLQARGHQVMLLSGDRLPVGFSLDSVDAAIIGASIHISKYPAYIKEFVATHRDWLNSVPTAFFTVCMAIRSKKAESRNQAAKYGEDFLKKTGWLPTLTATFAGAVKYTQYNFITRYIMKKISKSEGGSTDTSHDHEYTDWSTVTQFADEFSALINDRVNNREHSPAS